MDLGVLRLASGALAIYLMREMDISQQTSLLFMMTLSHNVLALIYSESQRTYLWRNWRTYAGRLSLLAIAASVMIVTDSPPVYFLFGIHHVFNETFFLQTKFSWRDPGLMWARGALNGIIFFLITRGDLAYYIGFHQSDAVWGIMLGAATLLFSCLLLARGEFKRFPDFFTEMTGVAFAIFSLLTLSGTLDHFLFYHYGFWALYPVNKFYANRRLGRYVVNSVAIFGIPILFTPVGPHWGGLANLTLDHIVRSLTFFHILSSTALSRAHPAWIQRLFFKLETPASESFSNEELRKAG